MAEDFARGMINAFESGMRAKRNKRIDAEEIEDRDVEKQLLQHRLKEITLKEKMDKRQEAKDHLAMLEGQPEDSFPSNFDALNTTQGQAHSPIPGYVPPEGMKQAQVPEIEIPGVYGPSIKRKPMTMEQIMANNLMIKRAEEAGKTHVVGRGGKLVTGSGETIAEGQPYTSTRNPPNPIPIESVDEKGVSTIEYVPPQDAVGRKVTKHPKPTAERTIAVKRVDPNTGVETTEYMTTAEAKAAGVLTTKLPDANTGSQRDRNVQGAIDTADAAVKALEDFNNSKASNIGVIDSIKGFFDMPGEAEITRQGHVQSIRDAIANLSSMGNSPSNKALEEAAKLIGDGSSTARLAAVKKYLGNRRKEMPAAPPPGRQQVPGTNAGVPIMGANGEMTLDGKPWP